MAVCDCGDNHVLQRKKTDHVQDLLVHLNASGEFRIGTDKVLRDEVLILFQFDEKCH